MTAPWSAGTAQSGSPEGTLALVNAVIHGMDRADRTWSALLVRGGRIVQVGSDADVLAAIGPNEHAEDVGGLTVVPGLIDAHQHLTMSVFEPVQVDCRTPPITELATVLDRLERAVAVEPPGRWVRGWGFHWSRVAERRNPSRADLDAIAPRNPLIVMDASYHGCFVNSVALDLAGIDRHSPPGRAGILVLDPHGELQGTLLEGAMDRPESLSWSDYVDRDPAASQGLLEILLRPQLASGITSLCDALVLPAGAGLLQLAARDGRLPLAIGQLFGGATFFAEPDLSPARVESLRADHGPRLQGGMVKLFVDAVHPSPAIDRPVDGVPDVHTGATYYGRGELAAVAQAAVNAGLGVAMHALGDCAIDLALDALGAVRRTEAGRNALLRIEHFVLASRDQARRAADLGVVVVTNPGFVDTWGDQYLERWIIDGRPDLHVLPLRDLLDAGVELAAASDYPCDTHSPFHGMWAAVARRSWTGELLCGDQAVSAEEALRLYTRGAAAALGTTADEGTLEVGKRANLAVLDRDPLACPVDDLADIRVLRTYVDGVLVFERAAA